MSENLVAFLEAGIAEDEATARACPAGKTWTQVDPERSPGRIEDEIGDPVVYDEGAPSVEEAAHIARHDPARVLREVEAKRKILALHTIRYVGTWPVCAHCRPVDPEFTDDLTSEPWPCRTLRLLAQVYSDHPDYAG